VEEIQAERKQETVPKGKRSAPENERKKKGAPGFTEG
jgi:hypothetical protein